MTKFAIVSQFLLFIVVFGVNAGSWLDHLPEVEREMVERNGYVERILESTRGLGLLPEGALEEVIYPVARSAGLNVLAERLIVVPGNGGDDMALAIFNLFYQPSALSYLRYYNPVKGVDHDLFKECFLVSSPDNRERLPELPAESIPAEDVFYMVQGLPPFGDVLQEFSVQRLGRGFALVGINHDPLVFRGVRVTRSRDMVTVVAVLPEAERTYIYALGGARVRPVFSMLAGDRIENSFTSRNAGLFSFLNDEVLKLIQVP